MIVHVRPMAYRCIRYVLDDACVAKKNCYLTLRNDTWIPISFHEPIFIHWHRSLLIYGMSSDTNERFRVYVYHVGQTSW